MKVNGESTLGTQSLKENGSSGLGEIRHNDWSNQN